MEQKNPRKHTLILVNMCGIWPNSLWCHDGVSDESDVVGWCGLQTAASRTPATADVLLCDRLEPRIDSSGRGHILLT